MVTICDYKQSQSISSFNRVMCPEKGGWSFSWGRGIVVCGGVHISSGCLPSAWPGTSELCQCVPWHPELFHNMSGIIQWFWLWGRLEKCTRECEMVFLLRETPVKESCLICKFNTIINVFLTVYGGCISNALKNWVRGSWGQGKSWAMERVQECYAKYYRLGKNYSCFTAEGRGIVVHS